MIAIVIAVLLLVALGAWALVKYGFGKGPTPPDPHHQTTPPNPGPTPPNPNPTPPNPNPGPTPWVPGTPPPSGWSLVTTPIRVLANTMQAPSAAEGPDPSASSGTYWCAGGGLDCSEMVEAPADAGGGIWCHIGPGCIRRQ